MEYIVQLVDSVAWPAAVVWLGFIFRGEIRNLLGRVNSLKYKDMEAIFDKGLTAAETEVKKITAIDANQSSDTEQLIYSSPLSQRHEQLLRIADESPRAAVLEAWIEVESHINEMAEEHGLNRSPPHRTVRELANKGVYSESLITLINDLRSLRNKAVHHPEFKPNEEQTERYLQMAFELSIALKLQKNK